MAYASAQDLLNRYDSRRIGDLAGDVGVRLTESQILTDSKVAAALDDASGKVMAAIKRANRYTDSELNALTGVSLAYLKRITCDMAFAYLNMRRGYGAAEVEAQAPGYRTALEDLNRLGNGEMIFDVESKREAGNPSYTTKNYTVNGQSMMSSETAKNLFGSR